MKRNNLKLFRMKQGLSSKEMAEKLEIDPTYYSNIENGRVNPGHKFYMKFGKIFKGQYEDICELFEN